MGGDNRARQWVLAARPEGLPKASDFRLEPAELAEPGDGDLLIEVLSFSVDPGMRSRLTADSYAPALPLGDAIESAGIGRVLESRDERFARGDLVMGGLGWRSHLVTPSKGIAKLDPSLFAGPVSATAAIGVLGVPGLTAYFGLLDLGTPKAGETVLISSAAGPVGATAGQIARLKGCRAVGIAGSPEKCGYLIDLGFDAAIDYRKAPDLTAAIGEACPDGIDVYFDNVGGEMLDAAILNTRTNARIVVSGQISEYNRKTPQGIRNTTRFITHRLRMEGLVVYDYRKRFAEAQAEIAGWIRSGDLTYREEISDGIEGAPAAFIGLFEGANFGRRLIRVAD